MTEEIVFSTIVEKCPTCGADALNRSEFWEAAPPNGNEIEGTLLVIRRAIENYYLAMDRRQHGGVAMDKAFHQIELALGMRWKQMQMTKFLEDNPRLKPFYD